MARLNVHITTLRKNLRILNKFCAERSLSPLPVTKLILSRPDILEAVGLEHFGRVADVHVANLETLARETGLGVELIRTRVRDADRAVRVCDRVLVSSLEIARAMSEAFQKAEKAGLRRPPLGIALMLEYGDLRDGVPLDRAAALMKEIASLRGLSLDGLAVNLGCLAGSVPDKDMLFRLAGDVKRLRKESGQPAPAVSVGGTVFWEHLRDNPVPEEITEFRVGEAFFFARNTSLRSLLPEFDPGVFDLELEVLEVWDKLVPEKDSAGFNAFGEPSFHPYRGRRKRAILEGGENQAPHRFLLPLGKGCEIIGATHEYLALDVETAEAAPKAGELLRFRPLYEAVSRAFLSPHMEITLCDD